MIVTKTDGKKRIKDRNKALCDMAENLLRHYMAADHRDDDDN